MSVAVENFRRANADRASGAGQRDAADAGRALAILGDACPDRYRRVADARIRHPDESWSVIADQLGMTKDQAIGYCRRLIKTASLQERATQ